MSDEATNTKIADLFSKIQEGVSLKEAAAQLDIKLPLGLLRKKLVDKYGREEFQAAAMATRPVPDFSKLPNRIKAMKGRLTDIIKIDAMIANLAIASEELVKIKEDLSS